MTFANLLRYINSNAKKYGRYTYGKFFRECVRPWMKPNSIILDAGCGNGWLVGEIVRVCYDCRVFGIDVELSEAKTTLGLRKTQVQLVRGDLHDLPFRPDAFDLVVSMNVFEHLSCPVMAIKSISASLRTDGIFVLTQSNCLNPLILLTKLLPKRILYRLPGSPKYKVYYRINVPRRIVRALLDSGFEICSVDYHPYSLLQSDAFHWLLYFGAEQFMLKVTKRVSSNLTVVARKRE